jgi:catechol 2,3-dioxygenase-like lactoylglutathione lyase family enzyme
MLDHMGFNVSDFARSRAFYESVLAPLGVKTLRSTDTWAVFGTGKDGEPFLWIGTNRPTYWREGNRIGASPIHVAFRAPSASAVDAFHAAALAAGGRDNGRPGPRSGLNEYYAAFVLDPDGNNIEAAVRL